MTTMRNRRRAERFGQLLDEAVGGRRHRRRTPDDAALAPLVKLRREISHLDPIPDIDPEFRDGLRAMLVATAEREGLGATAAAEPPTPPPRRQLRFAKGPRARTAAIAGVAIGAVAFAGMSTASENAVPGDALYGVKRSTERAQLALASSELGRGQLYLSFAQTRLHEATLLSDDLDRVLDDMDRDTSQGVRLLNGAAANRRDRAALQVIDGFVREQRTALRELASNATQADAQRVASSLALLDAVEDRADELRANLDRDCAKITSIDEFGPVPADCVALPPPSNFTPSVSPSPQAGQPVPQPSPVPAEATAVTVSAPPPTRTASTATLVAPSKAPPSQPSATPATPQADEQQQPADEPAHDGLLSSLNRLLGDLLGG